MNKEMDVDLIYYELKLQSLLEKFLENGYQIKNEVYLNRLFSLLEGKENEELSKILLKLPLMSEWILRAIKLWEDQSQIPDHTICAFTLHLLALISKNEITFSNLTKHNIYNRAINILDVRNPNVLPTIKLGFIKLLSSIVSHRLGTEWCLQTNFWQDVLSLSLKNQTVYITKESHLFVSLFLEAMLKYHDKFCLKYWQIITAPLLMKPDERFRNQENMFEACDDHIEKFLSPTIHLINDVLEYFFEKSLEIENIHVKLFKNYLMMPQLMESITNYLHIIRNQNLTYEFGKIWILLLYFSMIVGGKDGILKPDIDKEFMQPIFTLLALMVESLKSTCITKFLYFILVHWYKLKSKVKIEYTIESNSKFKFEDQFIIPLLKPNTLFCYAVCNKSFEEGDFKEEYFRKILSKACHGSIRWCYKWRYCLQPDEILHDVGPKTISYILQMKSSISRDCAVTIFQALIFSFVDINEMINENNHYAPLFAKCEIYLKMLLEALAEIITFFNLSWKDSLESICVIRSSIEFLRIQSFPSKLVIADLNLIKAGISKYLSPDLALLIDRKPEKETSIYTLGPLLRTKLHDPEWSVRDSALEVISGIVEASCIEFPSFRKIILNNDLCNLVLSISLNDGESFVRASALKCLNHLVKIDAFWKNELENQQVIQKMMLVLKCETEGIVRAQAINLLTTIVKYQQIELPLHQEIHHSMTSVTLDDFHWEVRVNGLSFWEERIKEKLTDQGMMDGVFPQCTFSPECKKIVNLTDAEIKKRIMRVLDQLSEMGCLTVLKQAISDDCDIQVSKKALEVSMELVFLIEKYKVSENVNLNDTGPPSNDSCYSSLVTSSPSASTFNSDEVIEQILKVSDNSLLKDVYNPGNGCTTHDSSNTNVHRNKVTTTEFLVLTKNNFKSLVNEKEKWINSLNSLSSLLNDMLESYEPNNTNLMDCY